MHKLFLVIWYDLCMISIGILVSLFGPSHVYCGMDVDTEHTLQQHNDHCRPTGIKIFSG